MSASTRMRAFAATCDRTLLPAYNLLGLNERTAFRYATTSDPRAA